MTRDTDYSVLFNQLLEVDGPFLTVPVVRGALGKLLEKTDQAVVDELRIAVEEREADSSLERRWVRWVLHRMLSYEAEVLREGPSIAHLSHLTPSGVTLRPDLVLVDPDADGISPRLLIAEWPIDQALNRTVTTDRWSASPVARMVELCQALKVPLGLVTNGNSWTVVYAPSGGVTSTANWEAELWLDERETLDLFVALLGANRFFGVDHAQTLGALLAESADSGEEVTTTLGRQVRRSVELLVAALSEANRERHGELLADVPPEQVYRGAVTVMMRLVFLLSAEERGLFLLGDDVYDSHYAISTMLDQLEEEPDLDVLFGRFDAWPRALATFRMIHGGVQHDDRLNLPAYGGELFDPNRFPFLEGRVAGEPFDFGTVDERLLKAINNRVMLEVLRSLQRLTLNRETRRLSFRHLDVEQIGTVYEGLLDHTCVVVSEETLGLLAKRSKKGSVEPEIALSELEAKAAVGLPTLEKWLKAEHSFTASQLKKLSYEPDELELVRLRSACGNDAELAQRIRPFLGVLRTDLRGLPAVYLTDSFVVTDSSDRSDAGAYYTPKSIAEELVQYALEPLVYEPGPQNETDQAKWKLRLWEEIADLKVLDPACGSGAMLVSTCRYLAERLVDAWRKEAVEPGAALPLPGAQGTPLALPNDRDDWAVTAMRLVADRCLYGVDLNPMAVEMCKLSLWLATLAKGKPFSFLDHAIRHGDSLLGVTSLDEIAHLRLGDGVGETSRQWFDTVEIFAKRALEKRRDLLAMPTVDAHDLEEKARLFDESKRELEAVRIIADALVGAYLSTATGKPAERDARLLTLAADVAEVFDDDSIDHDRLDEINNRAQYWLDAGRPPLAPERVPLHWPLTFPEVFLNGQDRFDATVSNPPFLGGQKITSALGDDFREHIVQHLANGRRGSADLVASFFLRANQMADITAYVATNTISQGDTSEVGLAQIIDAGSTVYRAYSSAAWPGDASVEVAQVWLTKGQWSSTVQLDGARIDAIDEMLYKRSPSGWRKQRLTANANQSFQGSNVLGKGFTMSPVEAQQLIDRDEHNKDVLFPYLGGHDLNQSPTFAASRWVINFFDWTAESAMRYVDCFSIVETNVKPQRTAKTYSPNARRHWWRFERLRGEMYRTIAELDRVLVIAQTSKTQVPMMVSSRQVFDQKLVVFSYGMLFHLGILTSGFHWRWIMRYGSTMRVDPVYTPSDVFETFPQPDYSEAVETAGRALDEHRSALMVETNEGLTTTYNRVHNPDDRTPDIVRLRELHTELDLAVRAAYGWDDLDLEHGFHPVRGQGIRYTFSPDAAVEVLYRLLELNRTRYEEEVRLGLHDGKKKSKRKSAGKAPQSETLFG